MPDFARPRAAAQKVFVDYDRMADFDSYKTFAWGPTPETSVQGDSPLMHSRIKNSIEFHLTEAGLIEDTGNPDLHVTYHSNSKEETTLHTTGRRGTMRRFDLRADPCPMQN